MVGAASESGTGICDATQQREVQIVFLPLPVYTKAHSVLLCAVKNARLHHAADRGPMAL